MNKHQFYDQGWNDRIDGVPYDPFATIDWRDGWRDCKEAKPEHQVRYEVLSEMPA